MRWLVLGIALLGGMASPAFAQGGPQGGRQACPEDARQLRAGTSLQCLCRPDAILDGSVWGTDLYTSDSSICRAARHAGMVTRDGGPVQVQRLGAQQSFAGSNRNGIETSAYDEYEGSFRFEAMAQPVLTGVMLCPETFRAYQDDGKQLHCLCPGEMTLQGNVWGSGTYTADSNICRAAVHAGVLPVTGGTVTVSPAPGQASYQGSQRNGVRSSDYSNWPASFRIAGGAKPAGEGPVQAPVAASLAARGQVQLYITFRTNSAELEASAAPVLQELRAALEADRGLRLQLVGHTDATGNAATNKPLSLRRAQSVRAWLVAAGVDGARLTVDGKGPDQPIADNGTDAGRALNRRVQAIRQQ